MRKLGIQLKEEISFLNEKIKNFENEKNKIKFCIHCKNEYNPLFNEKVSLFLDIKKINKALELLQISPWKIKILLMQVLWR